MPKKSNPQNFDLSTADFSEDFVWGVSTAAYQIEGAHNVNGKSESIWDRFVLKKGNIYNGHHGKNACEFYNDYEKDILLMKSMNIENFRLSISWTRLIPNGVGAVNMEGVNFYNKVINFCIECEITPWVTLYHWDLPQVLEDKGGWSNREILVWFEAYAQLCATNFGDRVKHWMVLNEPMVFTGAGYFLGVHAPGRKGLKNFLPALHHATMCQAIGGRVLRLTVSDAIIGTTFSCSQITPFSNSKADITAARKADTLLNRLFIEPSLGLGYPSENLKVLKRIEKYIKPGDINKMLFDFDFIGIQNYTREVVKHSYMVPYLRAKIIKATKRKVETTLMDWEVYPPSIYAMIAKYNSYEGIKKIIITENGAAFEDIRKNNRVNDLKRLSYLQNYLKEVKRAHVDGLKVSGYFVWSFTDNFEWAEGYYPRFGLVYIDFKTQKRIIKTSGKWFRNFLSKNKR